MPLSKSRSDATISNSVNSTTFDVQLTSHSGIPWPSQHASVGYTHGVVTELDETVAGVLLKSDYLCPTEVLPGHWLHTLHRHTMHFDTGDEIVRETIITDIVANQQLSDNLFIIPTE